MIDISKIPLTLTQFANGGPVIATGIAPINPYRDGKPVTSEVVGRRVTVVFPDNGYETQDIKVDDPTDALTPLLEKATYSNPVFVDFPGFAGHIYLIRDKVSGKQNLVISAKATAVRIVPAPVSDDDLEIAIE